MRTLLVRALLAIGIAVPLAAAAAVALVAGRVVRAERMAVRAVHDDGAIEALVVFGAGVSENGPCRELAARLDHAVALWQLGVAPVVLVSGGVANGMDEVDVMTAYLNARGLPEGAVRGLRPGYNTRATLQAASTAGLRRVVAVSSPYHAHRITSEAARHGLDAPVSAPSSSPDTRHGPTHRTRQATEVVAVLWYALPPSLAARINTGSGSLRHVLPAVLAGDAPARELLAALRRGGAHR